MNTAQGLGILDGPLVWIDCEMTGLNHRKDKILEIAVRLFYFFKFNIRSLVHIILGSHHERKPRPR